MHARVCVSVCLVREEVVGHVHRRAERVDRVVDLVLDGALLLLEGGLELVEVLAVGSRELSLNPRFEAGLGLLKI